MGLVFWKDYAPGAAEKEAMHRGSRAGEAGCRGAALGVGSSLQMLPGRKSACMSCTSSSRWESGWTTGEWEEGDLQAGSLFPWLLVGVCPAFLIAYANIPGSPFAAQPTVGAHSKEGNKGPRNMQQ